MARLIILVSVFAAGGFAKRAATKRDIVQLQKEAVASGAGILPGSAQPALPMRPAVMPRASVPVGMSMQESGNAGNYPPELRFEWKGLDTSTNVRINNDFVAGADWVKVPDWEPEEIVAMVDVAEKGETKSLNIRRAYDSLIRDIPQILQFESKGQTPMDWDIYTDDLKTDFPNLVDSAALGLFSAVASKHVPSWSARMKGKDLHKVALQEMRVFVDNFVVKAKVTGQDWCMDKDADWCVIMEEVSGLDDPQVNIHEGDEVITSNWKTELAMNTELTTTPEAVVTIQGLSRFHLNAEGKIYRHSINGFDISLNLKPEEAELFLVRLANAARAVNSGGD